MGSNRRVRTTLHSPESNPHGRGRWDVSHQADGGSAVDLNRSGIPLCEIVTEADIRSSAEAIAYMKALRSVFATWVSPTGT